MAVRTEQVAIDQIYTSTWQNRQKTTTNNILTATPYLDWLMRGGQQRDKTGGTYLEFPLEYANHSAAAGSFGRTHDFSAQNTSAKSVDIYTTSKVLWRNIFVAIYRSWDDDMSNSGEARFFDLMEGKLKNAEQTLKELLSTQVLGLNNHAGDITFEGIQNWVRAVPGPAYAQRYTQGEIPQGDYDNDAAQDNTWWNNQMSDMTGKNVAVHLPSYMRTMYNNCTLGTDRPDLVLTTQTIYESYEDEAGEMKQIVNMNKGDIGYEYLVYKGKNMIWDPGCLAYAMYFLNSKYIYLSFDPRVKFDITEWKRDRNDLDSFAQILARGNQVCTNRKLQGIIKNIGN